MPGVQTRYLHRQVCELETAGLEAERPVRKYIATGLETLEALKEMSGLVGTLTDEHCREVERAQPCDMKAPHGWHYWARG